MSAESVIQAQAMRVPVRIRAQSLREFAPGSRFSAGTRISSKLISACQTARSDALPVMTVAW